MHSTSSKFMGFALALTLLTGLSTAKADVITFNGLAATPTGTQVTTYTEGNFTVTPTQNRWNAGNIFGNPVPAIFSQDGTTSQIQVTRTTGGTFFTFTGIDLAQADTGVSTYTIQGFFNAAQVLLQSGTTPKPGFSTIASANTSVVVNSLLITFSFASGSVQGYTVDNIGVNLAAIPEPGTVALSSLTIGLGLGFSMIRRRWAKKSS